MAADFFAEIAALRADLSDKAQQAVETATRLGADACEVVIGFTRGIDVSTRRTEIENVEFNQSRSMGIAVFKDQRRGSASTSDLAARSIEECIAAALQVARYTDPDPCAGICEPELLCRHPDDFDLLQEVQDDPQALLKLSADTERAALAAADHRIKDSDGGSASAEVKVRVVASSHDFCVSRASSAHSLDLTLIGEENGRMQRGSGFSISCKAKDLQSPDAVAAEALERTYGRLNAFKPKSGRCSIIFTRGAARSLWGHLREAMAGSNIYLKSSFLCGRLGEQILPPFITLHEDPHVRGALGARSFDSEGAATFAQDWVKDGVLQEYLLSSYTSRKLGMKNNAHSGGCGLIYVQSSAEQRSLEDLMREAGEGLVIDSLMGQGVDIVSGNYSRGASGFYFKNGERVKAVHELTVAADLKQLYSQIAAVGNDVDERYSLRTGSLLIPDLAVSGA